jgi:signal peptidase I
VTDDAPAQAAPTTVVAQKPASKGQRSFLKELPFLVAIAFVLALLIKHFLVQAFYIPSGSMQQTLELGDRVLVNKVPYHWRGPHRGEIVVFNGVNSFNGENVQIKQPSNPIAKALQKFSGTIGLGAPNEKDYIKRVIGVPGDRVMCCDNAGDVVVTPKDGKSFSLTEPYVYQNDHETFCAASNGLQATSLSVCPVGAPGFLVPKGRLFVMGDHRGDSADSRAHGTIPEDKVIGRAFTVVYPLGHTRLLHVPGTFDHVALPAAPTALGLAGAVPITLVRRRRLRRRAPGR